MPNELLGEITLLGTKIEGTPAEVAASIFKKIICPNIEMLLKQNPDAAKVFAFHIMGLAISQYAELNTTKSFQKQLEVITHNMVQSLKKERGELKN